MIVVTSRFYYRIHILTCKCIYSNYGMYLMFFIQDVHCKYHIYLDDTDTITEKISLTSNPDFNHSKLFKFPTVTRQVILQYTSLDISAILRLIDDN